MFVHLRLHTEFSVVDGTNRIDDIVKAAAADGQPALAITDLNNLFGADQGLDAGRARFLVELDAAEQVVQVGDRQRRLAVGRRGLDGFVDAVGAIDDGKFGVQAQVNKHSAIVVICPHSDGETLFR